MDTLSNVGFTVFAGVVALGAPAMALLSLLG